MERLTFDGNFCDIAQCRELPCPYDNNCMQKQVWEHLRAYEDTGLTPEEVRSMEMDIAMINAIFRGIDFERMKELAEADKDGRVVVLAPEESRFSEKELERMYLSSEECKDFEDMDRRQT